MMEQQYHHQSNDDASANAMNSILLKVLDNPQTISAVRTRSKTWFTSSGAKRLKENEERSLRLNDGMYYKNLVARNQSFIDSESAVSVSASSSSSVTGTSKVLSPSSSKSKHQEGFVNNNSHYQQQHQPHDNTHNNNNNHHHQQQQHGIPTKMKSTSKKSDNNKKDQSNINSSGSNNSANIDPSVLHMIRKDLGRTFPRFVEREDGLVDNNLLLTPNKNENGFKAHGDSMIIASSPIGSGRASLGNMYSHNAALRKKQEAGLARVLCAIALDLPDIGYHQGLSFIAGFLLLENWNALENSDMAEDCTFWTIKCLLTKFGLNELFTIKSSFLHQYVDRFDEIVKDVFPKLYVHFHRELDSPFETLLYAVDWFTTMFCYSLKRNTAAIVWDCFIPGKLDDAFFLCGLAILSARSDQILAMDTFSSIMEEFKPLVFSIEPDELRAEIRKLAIKLIPSPHFPGDQSTLVNLHLSFMDKKNKFIKSDFSAKRLLQSVQMDDEESILVELGKYKFPQSVLDYALFRSLCQGNKSSTRALLSGSIYVRTILADPTLNSLGLELTSLHVCALLNHVTVARCIIAKLYFLSQMSKDQHKDAMKLCGEKRIISIPIFEDEKGNDQPCSPLELAIKAYDYFYEKGFTQSKQTTPAITSLLAGRCCLFCGLKVKVNPLSSSSNDSRGLISSFTSSTSWLLDSSQKNGVILYQDDEQGEFRKTIIASCQSCYELFHDSIKSNNSSTNESSNSSNNNSNNNGSNSSNSSGDDVSHFPTIFLSFVKIENEDIKWMCWDCESAFKPDTFGSPISHHQCNRCSHTFCTDCAYAYRVLLPKFNHPVRVCRTCHHHLGSCSCSLKDELGIELPLLPCQHKAKDFVIGIGGAPHNFISAFNPISHYHHHQSSSSTTNQQQQQYHLPLDQLQRFCHCIDCTSRLVRFRGLGSVTQRQDYESQVIPTEYQEAIINYLARMEKSALDCM